MEEFDPNVLNFLLNDDYDSASLEAQPSILTSKFSSLSQQQQKEWFCPEIYEIQCCKS